MKLFFVLLMLLYGNVLCAVEAPNFGEILANADKSPVMIRIYEQVMSFTWPKGFTISSRSEKAGAFTQAFKLTGEEDEAWTQKILLTGMQGASIKAQDPIQLMSNLIKMTYKNGCPKHFSATDVGEMKIQTGQSAFVFMVGCGITKPIEQSDRDKMLVMAVVIKGSADIYAIQWIERSSTEKVPPTAWAVWRARLDSILPIQLH